MDGLILALIMIATIFLFMGLNKVLLPRLEFEDNKSSRAVLCFIVIAVALSVHQYVLEWLK